MIRGDSYKRYILVFLVSLSFFLGGLNYKRWHDARDLAVKRISLIFSIGKNAVGNGNIEESLRSEFRKRGIEPLFDKYYLDGTRPDGQPQTEHVREYLGLLGGKSVSLILAVGDEAVDALLSTRHRLLVSVPVVAFNVHYPDEKLIAEYDRQKVYVLRDVPDLKRNMDFIKALHPRTGMEIVYNVDMTARGRKSFDMLTRVTERKNVRVLGYRNAFTQESEYKELERMIEYFDLMPGSSDGVSGHGEVTVSLCPFRYIEGASLLVLLEKSKREEENQIFLLDRFDMMAMPIVNALNIPSFSCIREGFGENAKIVGGYMATERISASAAADLAARLLNREKIGMPKIRDLQKEYVLDWRYFSEYAENIGAVPNDVLVINYPFYDRYKKEIYLLGVLFILAFVLVCVSLLRTYRRSLSERRNLRMLEEAHKRLSLSVDGGKISLWNIQDGVLEFDENYAHMAGLKERRFTREDFLKYIHPDDVQLLYLFYETLHRSPGMRVQRIRFCFGAPEEGYQWYELRCSSMKDTHGEIMLAGIMQNIQDLVEREHQLIQAKRIAEKAELKQSFLNNMSHEIRTPLNAIVGFTNLLTGEGADELSSEERAAMLQVVNTNNQLLLKLVNDVLEISRLDSGSLCFDIKQCDLTNIVKEIYVTYKALIQPSLQFVLDMDEDAFLPVAVDHLRFTQVISNFLNNANKFTREGSVTLGCRVDRERREVRVYVKDTGKGIGREELLMIFDRFYKTNEFEQGSGLGLPICKEIVERLSGRIEVDSEEGKGSCFSVILSLADAESCTEAV